MEHVLVNFRVPAKLLERFDSLCQSSDRTRTQTLRDMMRNRLSVVSRRTDLRDKMVTGLNRLEAGLEGRVVVEADDIPRQWSIAASRPLKSFSEFAQSAE